MVSGLKHQSDCEIGIGLKTFFFVKFHSSELRHAGLLKVLVVRSEVHHLLITVFSVDRESKEHDEAIKIDTTEEQLPPAKVPINPKQDLITSKKQAAMRKDRKKQQEKLRSMGSPDYSPLPVDKHETEFVSYSEGMENEKNVTDC